MVRQDDNPGHVKYFWSSLLSFIRIKLIKFYSVAPEKRNRKYKIFMHSFIQFNIFFEQLPYACSVLSTRLMVL